MLHHRFAFVNNFVGISLKPDSHTRLIHPVKPATKCSPTSPNYGKPKSRPYHHLCLQSNRVNHHDQPTKNSDLNTPKPTRPTPAPSPCSLPVSMLSLLSQPVFRLPLLATISALLLSAGAFSSSMSLPSSNILTSSLTSLGPTIAGLAVLAFVIVIHEAGHYLAARVQNIRVQGFSIGFGPKLIAHTPKGSETEFALRLFPFGGYVAFPENSKVDEETGETVISDDPNLLQNRSLQERAFVISAGVLANLILSWGALFTSAGLVGVPHFTTNPGVIVSQLVSNDSPAAIAGLKRGDVILSIDGTEIPASNNAAITASSMIHAKKPGDKIQFMVRRGNGSIVPGASSSSSSSASQEIFPVTAFTKANSNGESVLGVGLQVNGTVSRDRVTSIAQAVAFANREMVRLSTQTAKGFFSMIANFQDQSSSISGPIGVVSIGADLAKNDTAALFMFVAVISINLAFINSLPLPALDGGQMAFILLEYLRGSPVSSRIQESVNGIALLLFLAISGVLLFGDLEKLQIFTAITKLFG